MAEQKAIFFLIVIIIFIFLYLDANNILVDHLSYSYFVRFVLNLQKVFEATFFSLLDLRKFHQSDILCWTKRIFFKAKLRPIKGHNADILTH